MTTKENNEVEITQLITSLNQYRGAWFLAIPDTEIEDQYDIYIKMPDSGIYCFYKTMNQLKLEPVLKIIDDYIEDLLSKLNQMDKCEKCTHHKQSKGNNNQWN